MSADRKRYRTQWAAQFFAAAELTRRGYLVSFTLGNAPVVDLMAVSPTGTHFEIDVKGLSSKNFWLTQERESRDDLFYILVYLPPDYRPPNFYIFTSKVLMENIRVLKTQTLESGKKWIDRGAGINWRTALEYQDRWDLFPG
jgi:hypothetical protein